MSKLLDLRNGIKDRLVAEGVLAAGAIVVERQTEVISRVTEVTAKLNSVACTIGAASGRRVDESSKSLLYVVTVRISLWAKTVLSVGQRPEEDVFEALVQALHGHLIAGVNDLPNMTRDGLRVGEWDDVPDPDFLRRDVVVTSRISLR